MLSLTLAKIQDLLSRAMMRTRQLLSPHALSHAPHDLSKQCRHQLSSSASTGTQANSSHRFASSLWWLYLGFAVHRVALSYHLSQVEHEDAVEYDNRNQKVVGWYLCPTVHGFQQRLRPEP